MKEILLENFPLVTTVDDEDFSIVKDHTWSLLEPSKGYYYAYTYIHSKLVLMHRLITGNKNGVVDHINHNGLDNTRKNLKVVTQEKNMWNRRKHVNNKSGYIGVSYDKTNKHWIACISVKNKNITIGSFMFDLEAAFAYDDAVRKYRGKEGVTNF